MSRLQQLSNKKAYTYLFYELFGNILIYLSGILPFVHVLIPDNKLENKFFGYSSIHRFAYSLGNHASMLFIVLGLLLLIPLLSESNVDYYRRNLKYALLSPFISAVFFLCWVFIPEVNFNILAYTFIGLCVSAISFFLTLKLMDYLSLVKLNYLYKEELLNKGIEYLDSKI